MAITRCLACYITDATATFGSPPTERDNNEGRNTDKGANKHTQYGHPKDKRIHTETVWCTVASPGGLRTPKARDRSGTGTYPTMRLRLMASPATAAVSMGMAPIHYHGHKTPRPLRSQLLVSMGVAPIHYHGPPSPAAPACFDAAGTDALPWQVVPWPCQPRHL